MGTVRNRYRARSFGARVRQAREMAGLTQAAVAEAIGIDHVAVSRYERGAVVPRADRVVALARTLSVSCSWLLGERL